MNYLENFYSQRVKCFKERSTQKFIWMSIIGISLFCQKVYFFEDMAMLSLSSDLFSSTPSTALLFPPLTFYATAAPNVPQKMGNFQIIKLCCLSTSNYKGVAVLCVSLIIAIFSDLVRRNG